jgi:hypothetical protein
LPSAITFVTFRTLVTLIAFITFGPLRTRRARIGAHAVAIGHRRSFKTAKHKNGHESTFTSNSR